MNGAFTAGAFQHIGSHYKGLQADNLSAAIGGSSDKLYNFGGNLLTSGQVAQQIAAHALVGGISAELAGGKFGHGFVSAGITRGVGANLLPSGNELGVSEIAKGTIVSSLIGGTSSVVTGGKFADGARTGDYQYLFNQVQRYVATRMIAVGNAISQARTHFKGDPTVGTYVYENTEECGWFTCTQITDPKRFWHDGYTGAQAATFDSLYNNPTAGSSVAGCGEH